MKALFDEQERNRRWFEENYEDLVEKYDGMFVAVCKEEVVGYSTDPGELRGKILSRGLKLSEVMVEYVSKQPQEFIL